MSRRSNTIAMRHKMAAWRAMSVFRQPYLQGTVVKEEEGSGSESDGSDSEMYDTDLELDDVKKSEVAKTKKHADREVNANRYKMICDEICQAQQRTVIKNLSQEVLNLSNRNLGHGATTGLFAALVTNSHVTHLDLSGNDLGYEGGQDIAAVLEENYHIEHLNLSNNNFGKTGVAKRFSEMMQNNTSVLELNLSGNDFDEEDAKYLAYGIHHNDRITSLDLSHNAFEETGAQYIGKGLGDNGGIVHLNLSWNNIRKKGAVTVFKSLKYNCILQTLDMSFNGLGYEGSLSLGEMLKKNKTLKFLDVRENRINWEGAIFIAGGLQENDTLHTIKLAGNPLTTTGCLDIVEAIYENASKAGLKLLDIEGIPVVKEFEMTAFSIQRKREFNWKHGGVVPSHDILGSRHERRIHPMQRIIDYMNEMGLRPVELLRSFDKDVKFKLSEEEFVSRIQGTGIQLHKHEIEELMEFVRAKGKKKNGKNLTYDQLVDSVLSHVESDRNFHIAKREYSKKKEEHHHQMLNPSLPPLEKIEETPRKPLTNTSRTSSTKRLTAGSLLSTRALNPVSNISFYKLDSRPPTTPGSIMVSMTAPVIGQKPKKPKVEGKKKRKRKKQKAPLEKPEVELPEIQHSVDVRQQSQMDNLVESMESLLVISPPPENLALKV